MSAHMPASRWAQIDPKLIAASCSPRHIQSVLEDAQQTIDELLSCLKQLVDGMVDEEDSDDRVLERSRSAIAKASPQ